MQVPGPTGCQGLVHATQHTAVCRADRAAVSSMPCSTQHSAEQRGQHSAQQSSTQHAEQTEQHAACHAAHSIMQSRQSSTVHSRAAHSMPCSTQYAEQTEQQLAACHAAHSIMQSSTQHYAEQTVSNYSNYTRRSWTGRTGWSSGRARA